MEHPCGAANSSGVLCTKDTPEPDHTISNNILVFNLQPLPPRDHNIPNVHSQATSLGSESRSNHPPAITAYGAGTRQTLHRDSSVSEHGDHGDLCQNGPPITGFVLSNIPDTSSGTIHASADLGEINLAQNHNYANQHLHEETKSNLHKSFNSHQKRNSFQSLAYQRQARENKPAALQDTMTMRNKSLNFPSQRKLLSKQRNLMSSPLQLIYSRPNIIPCKIFKIQETMQNSQSCLQLKDIPVQSERPPNTAKSGVQYLVPLIPKDVSYNVQQFQSVKAKDHQHGSAITQQTTSRSMYEHQQLISKCIANFSSPSQADAEISLNWTDHTQIGSNCETETCGESSDQSRDTGKQNLNRSSQSESQQCFAHLSNENTVQMQRIGPDDADDIPKNMSQQTANKHGTPTQDLSTGCMMFDQNPIDSSSVILGNDLPQNEITDCDTDSGVIYLGTQYNPHKMGLVQLKTLNTRSCNTEECTPVDYKKPKNITPKEVAKKSVSDIGLQSAIPDDSAPEIENTVNLSQEDFSGLRILETVSLAGIVPASQVKLFQQVSKEGFYRCGILDRQCSFTSQFSAHFETHMQDAHNKEMCFWCVHCGSQERSSDLLLYHLEQHLDFQRLSMYCTQPTCNFHSFSPDSILSHMVVCHPNLSTHRCWYCSQVFGSLQQLTFHVKQNLLQVATCPHCDAKDTEGQRILSHITKEHSGQARMIIFHRLLVCRERKMSGWAISELTSNEIDLHDDRHVSRGVMDTDCGKTVHDGIETESRENFGDKDSDQSQKQTTGKDSSSGYISSPHKMPKKGLLESAKSEIFDEKICEKALTNTVCETALNQHKSPKDISSLKLLLRWNREGLKVVHGEKTITDIENADSSAKLEMEPVDYEISTQAPTEHDMSDHANEPLASYESDSTLSSSGRTSSSTLTSDQRSYRCTLMSEGKSIRLTSSMNHVGRLSESEQKDVGVNCPQTRSKAMKPAEDDDREWEGITSSHKRKGKTYTCRLCSYVSHLSTGIYKHMYSKHKETLACPLCKKRCPTRTLFFHHLTAKHHDKAKTIYQQTKMTKWIQITNDPEPRKKSTQATCLKKLGKYQEYPVKDYFLLCGFGKERSFHCVFCDFSFKKYHRSNAHIYRSMYKHLLMRHIPQTFQCPHCSFTNCAEEKAKEHILEMHNERDQDPKLILLPIFPQHQLKSGSNENSTGSDMSNIKWPASDAISDITQENKIVERDQPLDKAMCTEPSQEESPICAAEGTADSTSWMQFPSQSVFPERERVPSFAIHHPQIVVSTPQDLPTALNIIPTLSSEEEKQSDKSSDKSLLIANAVSRPRPRDYYSVEHNRNLEILRCLHCQYSRSTKRGDFNKRSAMIRHVQNMHMKKREMWKCSLCHFRSLKHLRVARHCKKAHSGKAKIHKEQSTKGKGNQHFLH